MSDVQDEENDSISHSSDNLDELENGYESNDTDSLNLDDEEEEDDGSSFPIPCLSDRLMGGSLVLHIDQTGATPSSAPASIRLGANHSPSTTTSLSDTASDGASTRALMGDTPSTTETNAFAPGEEDAADNSSQASMAESEAERVRRIHNSIFSSLEHDLAELVRIREETIQFLETGVRSGNENAPREGDNMNGDGGSSEENQTIPLRERLTYYTRPFVREGSSGNAGVDSTTTTEESKSSSFAAMQARTYTPIAKFDNAPPAKPAKPYVEAGLAGCDDKAAAARKILDKLQYGDPEDENACFVRRFWRETSTVVDTPPTSGLSLDVAAIAQRTASLQASLEEAFDGLRLRLHQVQTEGSPSSGQEEGQAGISERNGGESDNENTSNNAPAPRENEYYQMWEEETSIINNPLNYDIWNELEEGNEAGPTITARINMAERRAIASSRTRQRSQHSNNNISTATASDGQQQLTTSTVGVGTDSSSGRVEGAELDDDSTDDEEMMSYFRVRCTNINNGSDINDRPSNLPRALNPESRAFFQEIGISEQMGQDLFNMFSFSDEEVQLPANLRQADGADSGMNSSEIPEPLFPRNSFVPHVHPDVLNDNNNGGNEDHDDQANDGEINDEDRECPSPSLPPQIPMVDSISDIRFAPNREDDCSTMVYLDENYLNFPINRPDESHNEDH